MRSNNIVTFAALLTIICLPTVGHSMIYSSGDGVFWDPSIIYHDGKYHLFAMQWGDYKTRTNRKSGWQGCLYTTSKDGVHWEDGRVILEEREEEAFFKPFVTRCGDRFIMNHGARRYEPDGQLKHQDVLRFYQSKDLVNWTYITSTRPDERWYNPAGTSPTRWDHMYMLPKEEGNPEAGYWGYVVSISKSDNNLPGMMQSKDGVSWEVLPPAKAQWGAITPRRFYEYGGCERIGGKYYLIGGGKSPVGTGYGMVTFVSEGPRGTFRPDETAFRLCGTTRKLQEIGFQSWLAAWARGQDGEKLISNYISIEEEGTSQKTWLLPLRKAVVDPQGHLRLGWWQGNEALKGEQVKLQNSTIAVGQAGNGEDYQKVYLAWDCDHPQGLILEGTIRADQMASDGKPAAGFFFTETADKATAVLLGVGAPEDRESHIGILETKDGVESFESLDVTGKGCATVTGIEGGKDYQFRLLIRSGIFELYINDLLMQTFKYSTDTHKVGFVTSDARAQFKDLKAWKMSLGTKTEWNVIRNVE